MRDIFGIIQEYIDPVAEVTLKTKCQFSINSSFDVYYIKSHILSLVIVFADSYIFLYSLKISYDLATKFSIS